MVLMFVWSEQEKRFGLRSEFAGVERHP